MLLVVVVFPLVPGRVPWLVLTLSLGFLTYLAARWRSVSALHLGVSSTSLLVALLALGSMDTWPLPPLLALLAYAAAVAVLPALGGRPRWLAWGVLNREVVWLMAASIVLAGIGLVGWFAFSHPSYAELTGPLPHLPTPVIYLGMIVFCFVNAAAEELVYRGVLLAALEATLGASAWAIVLQAIAFGTMHAHGVPRGFTGIGLTTIYGLMMGGLRRRARGMLAPWLAHAAADVIIGSILLRALL
jgi:membrane protease YdiL (CAAX protease family)